MRNVCRRATAGLLVLPLLLALAACAPEPIPPCAQSSESAVCGFAKPEDLVAIPGAGRILAIEHGGETAAAGFSVIDPSTMSRTALSIENAPRAGLGDAACTGPPEKFAPGGIDLAREGDGFRVLAVNRAPPSRIEFYTLHEANGEARLQWNGCVPVPAGLFLNDVAALPDGGFAATHMVDPAAAQSSLAPLRFFFGFDTGHVVRWNAQSGWTKIVHGEGGFPNGIAVTPDGRTLYFAETFGEAVNRIDLETGERMRRKLSFQPDNLTWSESRDLIAVGHDGLPLLTTRGCRALKSGEGCGFSFRVARISNDLANADILFRSDGGSIPGASTALLFDRSLWLGTAFGDRVTRVSVSPPSAQTPPVSR